MYVCVYVCMLYIYIYIYIYIPPVEAQGRQDKYGAIMEKKLSTSFKELCEGMPEEFATYLEYSRNLAFDEDPDYRCSPDGRCPLTMGANFSTKIPPQTFSWSGPR